MKNIPGKLSGLIRMNHSILFIFAAMLLTYTPMAYSSPPGEMTLILNDTKTGKQVEARLTREAMERGKGFRELSGKSRTLKQGTPEQLAVKKEIDDILNWYRTAPAEKVDVIKVLK